MGIWDRGIFGKNSPLVSQPPTTRGEFLLEIPLIFIYPREILDFFYPRNILYLDLSDPPKIFRDSKVHYEAAFPGLESPQLNFWGLVGGVVCWGQVLVSKFSTFSRPLRQPSPPPDQPLNFDLGSHRPSKIKFIMCMRIPEIFRTFRQF